MMTSPANLMEKARPTPTAAAARATAERKRYHLGAVIGTPFQHVYLPATPETGTICFPQHTVFRSKPDARGQRVEMPQPGAFHDLTEEDVRAIVASCANRIVRWDAGRARPKIMHVESRGFRPASGQEGQPLDEPLCNYVYLRPHEPSPQFPQAGGLFEPIRFSPLGGAEPAAAPGGEAETPTAEIGGAGVSPEAAAGISAAAGSPGSEISVAAPAGKPPAALRGAAALSAAKKATGYRERSALELPQAGAGG